MVESERLALAIRRGGGVICSGNLAYDVVVCTVDEPQWGTSTFVESLEYQTGGNGASTSAARGCAIYTGGREICCPAFDVEARDTTGAGDCFAGGFLAALMRGADLAEAGRLANAVAARCVEKIGAVAGVCPYEDVVSWMRSARLRSFSSHAKSVPGDLE